MSEIATEPGETLHESAPPSGDDPTLLADGGDAASAGSLSAPGTSSSSRAEPRTAFSRAEMLGRYVLLKPIGAGGMGEVYEAYDPDLDRLVAVKVLRSHRRQSQRAATRMRREAQALAKLSHPNVVPIYDVGEDNDRMYFAMELVRGETFSRWTEAADRDWQEVVDRYIDAARGLQAAHEAGIVHRDVKPDNLLIGVDGRVRVLDLGIAKVAGAAVTADGTAGADGGGAVGDAAITGGEDTVEALDGATRLTRAGAVLGTPAYMAPEQFEGGEVDGRTDQFALCAALFRSLYRQPAFQGETFTSLCAAIVTGDIQSAPAERDVPAPIRKAVRRGLSTRPADRFPDMNALIAALDHDPSRRRRRVAVGFVAATFVGLVGSKAARPSDPEVPTCAGVDPLAALAWHGTSATDLVERAPTGAAAEYFIDRVDAWREGYAAARLTACQQTRVDGTYSEAIMDARARCLDRAAERFDATIASLELIDEVTGDMLVALAPEPSAPAACLDIVTATGELDDRGEGSSDAVGNARRDLAFARADLGMGRHERALERSTRALSAAREAEVSSLVAEATYLRGRALVEQPDLRPDDPTGRELLVAAAGLADAAGHDRLRYEVLVQLVRVTGYLQGDTQGARAYAELAEGARARLGGDPDGIDVLHFEHLGMALYAGGDFEASQAAFGAALEAHGEPTADVDPVFGRLHSNLGNVLAMSGEIQAGIEHNELALRHIKDIYGDDHPLVFGARNNLGVALQRAGRHEAALEQHERSLAGRKAAFGEGDRRLANAYAGIGLAWLGQGATEQARTNLARAASLRGRGGRPEDRGETSFGLAQAWSKEDPEVAMRHAKDALMAYAETPNTKAQLAAVQGWIAEREPPAEP